MSEQLPLGFTDIENAKTETKQCQAKGGQFSKEWIQNQVECTQAFLDTDEACSNREIEDLFGRAAELGIVPSGSKRSLCTKVSEAEQVECLARKSTCPKGMTPNLPDHPNCCVPISDFYSGAKTSEELKQFLDTQTELDETTKIKLQKETASAFEVQKEFEKHLPNVNQVEKRFVSQMADMIAVRIRSALELSQLESQRKLQNASTGSNWTKTMQAVGSFFVAAAKKAFDVIAWILSHPVMAMWITQLALRLKKKLCRELSLAFGFGGGEPIETDLLTIIKERSKRFYNENWEAVALSVMHRFVNGVGFDWLTNGVASGLSYVMSSAAGALLVIPGVGWAGASVLYGVSYLAGSGIQDILKETLREAAVMGTTGLIMQKTGSNFIELISGECLQTQPNDYVWIGMNWFGETKEQ